MGEQTKVLDFSEDVVPDGFAASLRLPLIRHPYPRWYFITAVVVSDELWPGVRPTDDELRVVASFHEEYVEHWFGDNWFRRKMAKQAYDVDGGAVGRFLIKHQSGGWGYRRSTWNRGPTFVPEWDSEPEGLHAVLDRMHYIGSKYPSPNWETWKVDHPDLFPTTNGSAL